MTFLAWTPAEWEALRLSLIVSLCCVALLLVPGVAVAWLLARCSFPGKGLVDAIVHLPLVLPPVVVGYLLLLTIGRHGPIGAATQALLGADLAFTPIAAVLASAVMALPLLVRAARLGFEYVDRGLEESAAVLGARPWRVWWTITLPLAAPGIITGSFLAFARSLGEFGATITVAGNIAGRTRTLPLAIYSSTQTPGGDAAAVRLVVLSVALSLGALVVSEAIARRVRRRRGVVR